MKIGLISDSHVPSSTRHIPEQVFHAFEGVDLILHAGDIYSERALDELEIIAPVLAVRGPGNDQGIEPPRVEDTRLVAIQGVHIGMVHILALPGIRVDIRPGSFTNEMTPGTSLRECLRKVFKKDVHVCVFGDSHIEVMEWHEDVLMVNPGSPTLPHQYRRLGTVGILDIVEGKPSARILNLKDFPGPEPQYK